MTPKDVVKWFWIVLLVEFAIGAGAALTEARVGMVILICAALNVLDWIDAPSETETDGTVRLIERPLTWAILGVRSTLGLLLGWMIGQWIMVAWICAALLVGP